MAQHEQSGRRLDPAHNIDDYNLIRDALAEYHRADATRTTKASGAVRVDTKTVTITLTLTCRADVPPAVLEWMGANLAEHAAQEFGNDYDPSFTEDAYTQEPLLGVERVDVQ